jgi:hypothetical protein
VREERRERERGRGGWREWLTSIIIITVILTVQKIITVHV